MSDTYTTGQPVYLTATVDNREQQQLPAMPGTWTASAGTITPDPTNPDLATLVNLPLGEFTATFTTTEGSIAGTYTATVVDPVPTSVTVTGSSTAPAAPATPAPAAA